MASVYIETTIPSYLTAWCSPELSMAAKQQTTRQWWDERRQQFDLFISDAVLLEASGGDPDAAQRRLKVLDGIPVLNPLPEADEIVVALVDRLSLPVRALTDAAHIALCIVHGMDYLLTWNCTHIANATFQRIIHDVCDDFGFAMPVICTSDQLMGMTMTLDPILAEVRRVREEYAQQFHGDVHAMMDDLRRRHRESDRQSASLAPKPRRKTPVISKQNGA